MTIRLAVSSREDDLGRRVAPRLRHAAISTCLALEDPPTESGEAVAFLGPGRPDPAVIEHWLSAGKHVLLACEVPLPGDALTILFAAAQRNNLHFFAVNPDRYLPSRQLVRQQLDAGKLGEAVLIRIHRWKPNEPDNEPVSPGIPGPLLFDLDLTLWLFDQPPNLVYAVERSAREGDPSSGRLLQVHLGFAGGGMALLDWNDCLPQGDGYRSLSVIGSRGAAYADDHTNMQLLYSGGKPQALRADEGLGQWAALLQEFVDRLRAVERNANPSHDQRNWHTVWTMAAALHRSLETRQAVLLGGEPT